MQKRSLGQTLARQWMLFAIVLTLLFAGMNLLALYVLEDHFLDQKLESVSQTIDAVPTVQPLPSGFVAYPAQALPADLKERFAGRSDGAHSEFRRANGRYVHALRARTRAGADYLLVYDVTDAMTVNRALSTYWLYALLLAALFALTARLLARWFMRRWSRSATRLMAQIRESASPEALQHYATQEPVQEFAELAARSAEAWQRMLDALAREQELLAFLNHELRTPLQSARTTLAALAPTVPASAEWSRLTRAIKRLERVCRSIRWLSSAPVESAEHDQLAAIEPLMNELLNEFQPLVARKGVAVQIQHHGAPVWPVPMEVAETLLANLLLNAVQHGDSSAIVVTLRSDAVIISNGVVADSEHAGTGMGLLIVQRWAQQFGLQLQIDRADASRYVVRVETLAGEAMSKH